MFSPYQEADDPRVDAALREACRDALHVVTTEGEVLRGARAILFMIEATGRGALAATGRIPPMLWMLELGYRGVARHRAVVGRILFRSETGGPFSAP